MAVVPSTVLPNWGASWPSGFIIRLVGIFFHGFMAGGFCAACPVDRPPLTCVLAPSTGAAPVDCLFLSPTSSQECLRLGEKWPRGNGFVGWILMFHFVSACGIPTIFLVLSVANWPCSLWRPLGAP